VKLKSLKITNLSTLVINNAGVGYPQFVELAEEIKRLIIWIDELFGCCKNVQGRFSG
jgi:hypothetical protein